MSGFLRFCAVVGILVLVGMALAVIGTAIVLIVPAIIN